MTSANAEGGCLDLGPSTGIFVCCGEMAIDQYTDPLAFTTRFNEFACAVPLLVGPPLAAALFVSKDLHLPDLNSFLTLLQRFFRALPCRATMPSTYRHSNRLFLHWYMP